VSLVWTAPGALWLLAVVPLVWLARRFARTNFNPRQQVLQAAVRTLLLAALAAALARPVLSLGSSRLSVVYAVDVSASVSGEAVAKAADAIDRMQAAVHPAASRVVAFGAGVRALDGTPALRQLAKAPAASGSAPAVGRDDTNLAAALDVAAAEEAPGAVPQIVLFSDGRETAGVAREAAAQLAADGIPVSTVPMATADFGDAWVDAIDAPDAVPAGASATVTVDLGSQHPAAGQVELREGTRVLASRPVTLPAGITHVPLEVSFDEPGAHLLEAVLTVPGDPLGANNRLAHAVDVAPRARVLYVEGAPAHATYLRDALTRSGFDVTVRAPEALPASREALDAWDVVILSDVARVAVPAAAMTALADWVEQDGGGLLVAGGESVFGGAGGQDARGYRGTDLEHLLPVTFERKDEPQVALVIVLDKSWSMAGQQMELCKTAAEAAIDALADEQSVGVISFNDEFVWDVRLQNVGRNRAAIRQAVAAIQPSGHTLIYPAIEQAYLALRDAHARAKHVVLLSDGRSYPDDYDGLLRKMVAAKITVSTIAVGPAADRELLGDIATWGRGRSYVEADAHDVPQIFVREAKEASTPAFDEKTIAPVVKAPAFLAGLDLSHVPVLHGITATVLKDPALEVMATSTGEPLLAFWPMGVGRTAVFASDVKDRWGSDWVRWKGYAPFFASVVRAIERRPSQSLQLDVTPGPVRGTSRSLAVALEARDGHGGYRNLMKPVFRVETADAEPVDVPARQTAPGRYEASVVADARQPLAVSVAGEGAAAAQIVAPDTHAEYRLRPPDEALLRSIAQATGGSWNPAPADLAAVASGHRARRVALWPALVALALGLWLLDLLFRRVRLFDG
jgi:Ca-activated chloride channel homolog